VFPPFDSVDYLLSIFAFNLKHLETKHTFFITCAPFVVPYLKQELSSLGFETFDENLTGVFIKATLNDTIVLNYKLLTAGRVLWLITKFNAADLKSLYSKLTVIEWSDYFSEKKYITFTSQTNHPDVKNTMYLNQLCKDAVVDFFQKHYSIRPDSGPLKSEVVIHVHWQDHKASVYLDTSGEQLNKHGYRQNPFMAPVQENLAAALILATGWDKKTTFINPMCGSGTFAIEAALMAAGKFPLAGRLNFGYMHLKTYHKDYHLSIKNELLLPNEPAAMPVIIASDMDTHALRATMENAKRAGVDSMIKTEKCDFADTTIPEGSGIVLLNPPYGDRLGSEADLELLYKNIGDFFKQKCKGKTGFIFTGESTLSKKVGLRTSKRMEFYNGPIECRLLKYDLY
jgi:putative N6-adenine-specific DNA methylase